MNVSELLKPLVDKSMAVKGYSLLVAVEKSHHWLAREIGVPVTSLHNLSSEEKWCAHAAVEKALTPPPRKLKKQIEMPELKFERYDAPLGEAFWKYLREQWGEEFFTLFFGDWTDVKVEGTVAPGQYALEEMKKANRLAMFDAA